MGSLSDVRESLPVTAEQRYPLNSLYSGPQAPCRFEAEVYNCTVRGEIPREIDGTYYRIMPDPVWGPLYDDDVFLNGDGCINAVRIHNGHADFKSRYVRTEKFCIERAARQSVFGNYQNRYSDDPRVRHKIHSTANTHLVWFDKQILALKEHARPYAIDPDTLETRGYYDFGGQYAAPTHTAHPKIDPANGEMITFGYHAKGDFSADIAYYLFDKDGNKLEECWFEAPFAGMMHDMGATDNWVVFNVPPLTIAPEEEVKKGHKYFAWDPKKPILIGIIPRRNPKPEDVRWFESKHAFLGHVGNAFETPDGVVCLDAPLMSGNLFWFFPPVGEAPSPENVHHLKCQYVRWRLDPNNPSNKVDAEVLVDISGEMPRPDDRYLTKPYTRIFLSMNNVVASNDEAVVGGTFNSIADCNVKTGKYRSWCAGANVHLNEAAFIPRTVDAPEGDGWLILISNENKTGLTSILIIDTAKLEDGPVAVIDLPFRLRASVHGSWVHAHEFKERKDLCDMSGVTDEIRSEFENKPVRTLLPSNVSPSAHSNGAPTTSDGVHANGHELPNKGSFI